MIISIPRELRNDKITKEQRWNWVANQLARYAYNKDLSKCLGSKQVLQGHRYKNIVIQLGSDFETCPSDPISTGPGHGPGHRRSAMNILKHIKHYYPDFTFQIENK